MALSSERLRRVRPATCHACGAELSKDELVVRDDCCFSCAEAERARERAAESASPRGAEVRKIETPSGKKVEIRKTRKIETPSKKLLETPSRKALETPSKKALETPSRKALETPSKKALETPSKKALETPSRKRLETPSRSKTETRSVKRTEKLTDTPSKRRLEAAARGSMSAVTIAFVGAGLTVALFTAAAVAVVWNPSKTEVASNDRPQPKPVVITSNAAVTVPVSAPTPAPVDPAAEARTVEAARVKQLDSLVQAAADLYGNRDFVGAKQALVPAKAAARASDADVLRQIAALERDIESALKAQPKKDRPVDHEASHGNGSSGPKVAKPEEAAPPAPAADLAAYATFRAAFDLKMARLDLAAAKALLASSPVLGGDARIDLENDALAVPALEKLLDLAVSGMRRQVGKSGQTFRLAGGKTLEGMIRGVSGSDVTVALGAGVEQTIKLQEIDARDLCSFARTGLPKDERDAYCLGRGLACYYAVDDAGAKKALLEVPSIPLARAFVARIDRDGPRPDVSAAPSPKVNPAKPEPSKPEPSKPDQPAKERDTAADLAALRSRLHVTPNLGSDGKFSVHYSFTDDAQSADFDNVSCDICDRNPDSDRVFADSWDGPAHKGLVISAGQSPGFALHQVPVKGDFVLESSFEVEGGPTSAELVFFCGWNGKKATGCDWRGNIVEIDRNGNTKAYAGTPVDGSKYKTKARNTVKLVREGTKVTYYLNGRELGSTNLPATEGPAGFMISQQKALICSFSLTGQLGEMKKK